MLPLPISWDGIKSLSASKLGTKSMMISWCWKVFFLFFSSFKHLEFCLTMWHRRHETACALQFPFWPSPHWQGIWFTLGLTPPGCRRCSPYFLVSNLLLEMTHVIAKFSCAFDSFPLLRQCLGWAGWRGFGEIWHGPNLSTWPRWSFSTIFHRKTIVSQWFDSGFWI